MADIQTITNHFNNWSRTRNIKAYVTWWPITAEQVQSHSLYTNAHIQIFSPWTIFSITMIFQDGKERLFFELLHRQVVLLSNNKRLWNPGEIISALWRYALYSKARGEKGTRLLFIQTQRHLSISNDISKIPYRDRRKIISVTQSTVCGEIMFFPSKPCTWIYRIKKRNYHGTPKTLLLQRRIYLNQRWKL